MRTNVLCRSLIYPAFMVLAILAAPAMSRGATATHKPAILITGKMGSMLRFLVEPQVQRQLEHAGYRVASLNFKNITAAKLKLFNVVVVLQEPNWDGASPGLHAMVSQKAALLRQYVRAGGGLLFFFDELHYSHSQRWTYTLNWMLTGLKARVDRQRIWEADPARIHVFSLLNIPVYRTRVLTKSPITAGVRQLWWPGRGLTGNIRRLGLPWRIIIRGSQTARSAVTWKSEPPLLAVRTLGRGRVALFMGDSSFYLNDGYSRAYQRGFCLRHGGYRLFTNLFNWLGAPSAGNPALGLYKPGTLPPPVPQNMIQKVPNLAHWRAWPGIFGVYTTFSGGLYTVEDFARTARKLGLKFLVFTDRITTAARWNQLRAACRKASDKNFIAIPGVQFTAGGKQWNGNKIFGGPGDEGFAANMTDWPPPWGLHRRKLFLGALLTTGLTHPGIYVIAHPNLNGTPPVDIGGFNALEIASYHGAAPYSQALNWYRRMEQIPGASLTPIVSDRIWSPQQLKAAAQHGFKLYLYSKDVSSLRDWGTHVSAGATAQGPPGFVSNGPVITTFRADHLYADPWEHYVLWTPGEVVQLHLRVRAKSPLSVVRVFSGRKLIRCFRQTTRKSLHAVINYPIGQDGPFFVEVRDAAGHVAFSYAIPTRNLNYWNHLGSDRMNDYHTSIDPDPYGTIWYHGRRYGAGGLVTFGYGWGPYCHFYDPVPGYRYGPQGYETGTINAGIANVDMYPVVHATNTHEMSNPVLVRGMPLSSRDVAIVSEKDDQVRRAGRVVKNRFITATNLATIFRYQYIPYGMIIMRADINARIINNINLQQSAPLGVRMLKVSLMARHKISKISYLAPGGKLITIAYNPAGTTLQMAKGGFLTLWPQPYGVSIAVFALAPHSTIYISGQTPVIEVGYHWSQSLLAKGNRIHGQYLICEAGGGNMTPQRWLKLAQSWNLRPNAAYQPPTTPFGRFLRTAYTVAFQARQGGVRTNIPAPPMLPNHRLPVTVTGINSNWTAGAYQAGRFYPGGTYRRKLYLGLSPKWLNHIVFLGNPLIASQPDLIINVLKLRGTALTYVVENPTGLAMTAVIKPSPALGIKGFEQRIKVQPGQTRSFRQTIEFLKRRPGR